MPKRNRVISLLGGGTLARLTLPKLLAACEQLGVNEAILDMGVLEINRTTNAEPPRFGHGGIHDVGPDVKLIELATGLLGSDEIAEKNRAAWEPLARAMVQKVLQVHAQVRLTDGLLFWRQGMRTGHALPAEEMLRELKRNLPNMHVVTSSVIPEDWNRRLLQGTGYGLFSRLKQDDVTFCTFLTDNGGPFAAKYKLDVQDRFLAHAEASLLGAQYGNAKTQSFAEVGRSLGDLSVFASWAFTSRQLITAKPVPGWRLLQQTLSFPDRGYADLANAIQQAKIATETVLTDPAARTIDEKIDTDELFFITYTVPIPSSQRKQWLEFAGEIRRWLGGHYRKAVPMFCVGNGCALPGSPPGYYLQTSVLFPVPPVPAPIREILDLAQDAAPPPVPNDAPNGHGSVADRQALIHAATVRSAER